MNLESHYLKKELYELIQKDPSIFDFLQSGSLDGIWYWDLENTANEWMSPRFWTALGYDPKKRKHLASEWQDLIHPEDLKIALDNFEKHCADPAHPYDQVVRYRHKDGSTVWVRCRGIIIRDKTGKPVRMLGAHTDITQLKQTEMALRDSEQFLGVVLDSIQDGIIVLDRDLNVVRANKAMINLHALMLPLEGKKCYKAFRGRSEPCEVCPAIRAFKTGKLEKAQMPLIQRNGAASVLELSAFPMLDDSGKPTGVVEYLQDITEQKHQVEVNASQLRLIEYAADHTGEELLQALLDEAEALTGSQIAFFHFVEDDQKNISLQTWSTNTLENMCDAEISGKHYPISQAGVWVDCIREKGPVIHNDYMSLTNRKGLPEGHAPVVRELVVPVLRGEKIMAILAVGNKNTPYMERDVQTVQTMADMAWEIFFRKHTEEELVESQKRYQSLFDDALDMVHILDNKGVLIDANRSELKTLGYSKEEYLGHPIINVIHPEYRVKTKQAIAQALAGQKIRGYETVMRTKEGRSVPVEVSAVPIFEKGEIKSVQAILRNMTERKIAEEELTRYREHLEELVDERTAELKRTNEKLRIEIAERKRAEKELRRYADTQAVLVREVNHRVKNNLSAIISMLHMEQDRAEAEGLTSHLPVLNNLVGRIGGLSTVHSLLSASGWRPMEISELCKQVVSATLQFVPLGKRINVAITPSRVRINSNQAHHLTLIVHELTTNTMKYALGNRQQANINIDIRRNGGTVSILFKDDGPGYPDHLFQDNFIPSTLGFELIHGITRRSLNGDVAFSNEKGAVARIFFQNELENTEEGGGS